MPLYGTNADGQQGVPRGAHFDGEHFDSAHFEPEYPWGYSNHDRPTNKENQMCRQVACKKCGKTTWAGCGQHVDTVMRGVKSADRCKGHEGEVSTKTGFFAKLFGR